MRLAAIHTYPVKGCRRLNHDTAGVDPWGLAGDRRWLVVDADGVGLTQRQHRELVTLSAVSRPGELTLAAPGVAPLDLAEPTGGEPLPVRVFTVRDLTPALAAGPVADEWCSRLLGRPARLAWLGDPTGNPMRFVPAGAAPVVNFADGTPLLLANAASLDALNGWLLESGSVEGPLPMDRFRANLVISGAAPWAEEDWIGRRIRIGDTVFHGISECGRCVVSTIDQETGERGHEPLRTLGVRRNVGQKLLFGLQLAVEVNPGGSPTSGATVRVGDEVTVL